MLSYQFCIKTLSPNKFRNEFVRSGNESHLRNRVYFKNSWRVTVYKVRMTKLILHAHLPLDNSSQTCKGLFRSWLSSSMYRKSLITDLGPCSQQCYVKQRPKYTNGGKIGTMGHPKGRKPYGGGDSVRESGFRCFSSISGITSGTRLDELMELNKKDTERINNKLIHIVSDVEVLILSYEIIKSKPGNSTPGIDSITLDGIDLN